MRESAWNVIAQGYVFNEASLKTFALNKGHLLQPWEKESTPSGLCFYKLIIDTFGLFAVWFGFILHIIGWTVKEKTFSWGVCTAGNVLVKLFHTLVWNPVVEKVKQTFSKCVSTVHKKSDPNHLGQMLSDHFSPHLSGISMYLYAQRNCPKGVHAPKFKINRL